MNVLIIFFVVAMTIIDIDNSVHGLSAMCNGIVTILELLLYW